MGIFSLNRQNRMSLSEDWKLFEGMFHHIGAFVYKESVQTAFFDENSQRILNTEKSLSRNEYQALLHRLKEDTEDDEQNIYLLRTGAEKKYLRIQITQRTGEELGFVEEMTNRMANRNSQPEYDAVTNLLTFQAFSALVQKKLPNVNKLCLASLRITGLDKIADFSSMGNANHCMASVAEALNRFADEKIILSVKGFQEFYICFLDIEEQSVLLQLQQMRKAVVTCVIADDFGQSLQDEKYNSIDLHAGLAFYPTEGSSLRELMTCAEFALFETRHDSQNAIIQFSKEDFERKKDEYREEQLFDVIMKENQLAYHFQPIVDAHTGNVAGYEILMRSEHFLPEQMLALGEKYGRLYEIEKATMFNAMRFLSEHQNIFSGRKLFINSIPTALLSESDWGELRLIYEDLFDKVVVEIIEQSEGSEEMLALLKQRCHEMNAQLAIDDYGSGYANSATLLKNMPQYVKIDRELITDICRNTKKQQLVAGIIDYAHENQIIVLAEGVEEEADLKTLIRMDVDLIQGFYTAKPKHYLLEEIPKDIKDCIITTNLEITAGQKKIYNVHQDEEINLIDLALQNYTDIHIYSHQVRIIGDAEKSVKMHIAIMENHSCDVRFCNVNMTSQEKPCIAVGNYAKLTFIAEGENTLNHTGIKVPEGSFFHLTGDGNVRIDCYSELGYGIGNDCESSYGCITLESSGKTEIICNNDRGIGIGGWSNSDDSEICLKSGIVQVTVGSPNTVGIGCADGSSLIYADADCHLEIKVNGINSVGIGSLSGEIHIKSSSEIKFSGAGNKVVGIGVLNHGTGEIVLSDADLNFFMRSNFGTCIGTFGGKINITATNCNIEVDAEGGEITGVGDASGDGDIILEHTELKAYILSARSHEAGSKNGRLIMKKSSIIADVNDKHNTTV